MKKIQIILIIAILVLLLLILGQWMEDERNYQPPILPPPVIVKPITPALPVELVPEKNEAQLITAPVDDVTPQENPEIVIPTNPELIEYKNNTYGYHFSLPKKVYYSGFGPQNGASHTIAIRADALPETFEDSTTRVLYYGKKVLPELKGATRYVDPNGKYVLLLLDNAYSVRIESDNLNGVTALAIQSTIGMN